MSDEYFTAADMEAGGGFYDGGGYVAGGDVVLAAPSAAPETGASFGDLIGVLRTGASTVGAVTREALGYVAQVDAIRNDRDQRAFERERGGLALDVMRTQAQTGAQVAKIQATGEVLKAQAAIDAIRAPSKGTEQWMLWLAAAGVGIAAYQVWGRKR